MAKAKTYKYSWDQVRDMYTQAVLSFLVSQYTAVTQLTLVQTLKVIRHLKQLEPRLGKFVKLSLGGDSDGWGAQGMGGKLFIPFGYRSSTPFTNTEFEPIRKALAAAMKKEGWNIANIDWPEGDAKWTPPSSAFEAGRFCFVVNHHTDKNINQLVVGLGTSAKATREEDYRIVTNDFLPTMSEVFGITKIFPNPNQMQLQLTTGKYSLFRYIRNSEGAVQRLVNNGWGLELVVTALIEQGLIPNLPPTVKPSQNANLDLLNALDPIKQDLKPLRAQINTKLTTHILKQAEKLYPVI